MRQHVETLLSTVLRWNDRQIPDFKQVKFIVYDSVCKQITYTLYTKF